MSYLMYNGQRLIPAPASVIPRKLYQKTGDGRSVGAGFSVVMNGTLLPDHGSPMIDGSFWTLPGYPPDENVADASRLKGVLRKQEAIKKLFSQEGYLLEIQSADGSAPMKFSPRIISVDFNEGLWYNRCDYTITLECDVIYINGSSISEDEFDEYISDASESWSLETDEIPEGIGLPRTYRMTHSVSATGKRFFDVSANLVKEAWQQAEHFVLSKLGYSPIVAMSSGINNLPDYYNGYNFSRSSQRDDYAGQYSATETWILASGKALEEFNCDIRNTPDNGLTNVTIAGTITGLEERDVNLQLTTKKYTNALSKWGSVEPTLLGRAQTHAGISLNPVALSRLIGKNDINGVITYSYDFDTRPSNLFSGMSYESLTISHNLPCDLFASIPVIGRANGPVLQPLSSITENSVTLNIELVTQPPSFNSGSIADLRAAFYSNPRITQNVVFNNIVQAARPGLEYSTSKEFVRSQNEGFDVKSGRYNYTIEWVFGN